MITASLVIFKTKYDELRKVLTCCICSPIDKIYIIDNSPFNDLSSIVESFESTKFEYIFGHGNVGFGHANNIGIRKAIALGSTYHIVLNPDIIFESQSIIDMVNFMDNHENIGMMTPALMYPDGRYQGAAMMLPTPFDMFGRRLLPKFVADKINEHYELEKCDLTKAREIPNMCGCFMFCRTEILQIAGLFDEQFFMYFEDFDLVRRVHKYAPIAYLPTVSVIHAHAAEHRKSKFLLKESIRSAVRYFNKWGWIIDKDRRVWNKAVLKDDSIIE